MSTCHQAGNAHLVLRRIAVRVRRRLGNGGDNSLDGLLSLLQSLLAVGLSSLNSLLGDIGNLSSGLLGGDDRLLLKDERCQYRLHKAAEQVTPHRGRSAYCGSVEEKVQTLKLTAASSSESEESEESEDSAFFAGAAAVALPLVALGAGLALLRVRVRRLVRRGNRCGLFDWNWDLLLLLVLLVVVLLLLLLLGRSSFFHCGGSV